MHRTAEQGIAAHWKYKEGRNLAEADGKAFAWLRQLMEWQRDLKDPTEFIESVKTDLFEEEVFVFTPKGDVKALPKGSTPVDLAYAVHSKVGDHCSGARVNGIIVPLRYALRNGDTVEILTSNNQKPSKDWLKFVVTSRAKTKIRHQLRTEQRERSKQYGHDLIARELRKRDWSMQTAEKEGRLEKAAAELRLASTEDLLVLVGYGKLTVEQAANAIYPEHHAARMAPEPAEAPAPRPPRALKRSVGGVRVQGEADIVVKFAKCCDPVPGDSIVAFISRARGVIVHTQGCPKALELDPERRVEVSWDEGTNMLRPVTVEVISTDKPGILAAISRAFTEHGVNIAQAKCKTTEDRRGINTFQVMVGHVDQLKTVMRAIGQVDGVLSVSRG
jgi:GTP pyrophosphokinase